MIIAVQRYISTRPMFIDVRELSAGADAGSVTDAAAAGIALRDLSQQYKGLLAAVKEEALVMEQVFPSPRSALAIFVQRVFEQRVQVWHTTGSSSFSEMHTSCSAECCARTPDKSSRLSPFCSLCVL